MERLQEGNASRDVGLGIRESLLLSLPLVLRLTSYTMGTFFLHLTLHLIYLWEMFLKAESAFNMRQCNTASKGTQIQMEPPCTANANSYELSQLKAMWEKTCILVENYSSDLYFKATVCLIVHIAACSCQWASWRASNSLLTGTQRPKVSHSSCWDHHCLVTRHLNTYPKSQMGSLSCSAAYSHGIAEWPAFVGAGHLYLFGFFKKNKHFIDPFNCISQTLI